MIVETPNLRLHNCGDPDLREDYIVDYSDNYNPDYDRLALCAATFFRALGLHNKYRRRRRPAIIRLEVSNRPIKNGTKVRINSEQATWWIDDPKKAQLLYSYADEFLYKHFSSEKSFSVWVRLSYVSEDRK
jgi:hypothetical protein